MNIKDIVGNNNRVYFNRYKKGVFYYRVRATLDKDDPNSLRPVLLEFPVPVEDVGDATMLDEDRAMLFMRWIRAAIKDKTIKDLSRDDQRPTGIVEYADEQ